MGIFNSYTKPGKGVSKEDLDKTGLALYFDILFRRFWKMITINFMYIVASIPAIIIASFIAYYFMGAVVSLMGKTGANAEGYSDTILNLMRYLIVPFTLVILQITGSGPASAAKTYMLRKYVKDAHVWLWSDFISSFKSNFRQGMAVYIINTLVFFVLGFGFLFYRFVLSGLISTILSALILMLSVIFFVMQKYVYTLLAGFKLTIKHIYKNAFALSIIGLKWNILSTVIVLAIMFAVSAAYTYITPVAFAIVLTLYYSIITFTQLFITRSVVSKYVEEPALKNEEQEESKDDDEQE